MSFLAFPLHYCTNLHGIPHKWIYILGHFFGRSHIDFLMCLHICTWQFSKYYQELHLYQSVLVSNNHFILFISPQLEPGCNFHPTISTQSPKNIKKFPLSIKKSSFYVNILNAVYQVWIHTDSSEKKTSDRADSFLWYRLMREFKYKLQLINEKSKIFFLELFRYFFR